MGIYRHIILIIIESKISGDWKTWDNPSNIPGGLAKYLKQEMIQLPKWYLKFN
jgi:hypothetical protein